MVRQFLFDAWQREALRALAASKDARIAEIAAKSLKEVSYHVERSGDWIVRLGDGTAVSNARAQAALDRLWPCTGEMFAADGTDRALHAAGIAADHEALAAPWRAHVDAVLAAATLVAPAGAWMQGGGGRGGRQGIHTEHLGHLLAEMQFLQRAYPNAQW